MSAFTKGKCEYVATYGKDRDSVVFSANGNKADLLATCPVKDNARFITFAPEMYELLKEFARCEDYVDAAILGIEAEELLARIDRKDTGHDE